MKPYLRKCNDMQRKAIMHESGPLMCLAGPGSGKTFVLTHHIKYLIEECHVEASHILVITFSKAAASEMQQRFFSIMENQFIPVSFGTFHAIFFHMLCQHQNYSAKSIVTLKEKKRIVRIVLNHMNGPQYVDDERVEDLLQKISYVKNSPYVLSVSDKITEIQSLSDELDFYHFYKNYQSVLKENKKLDFDDMMLLCYQMLNENKEILNYYQNIFEYLLIDEYQDINPIQYEIIKKLTDKHHNLFVVGDDDQSIYGFRGSDPSIMFRFKEDFKDGETIIFPYNYRSVKEIVETSKTMIEENHRRFNKEFYSAKNNNKNIFAGITFYGFANLVQEQEMIIELALKRVKAGKINDSALLVRTNFEAAKWAEIFVREKIPFQMKEKISNIYESFIAKDLLSYLRLAEGGMKSEDLVRIMNRPLRYMSRSLISSSEFTFSDLYYYYREKSYMQENIRKLQYDLIWLSKMDLYASINYIRKGIGYEEFLKKLALEQDVPYEKWLQKLNDIHERMGAFKSLAELEEHMEYYTEKLKIEQKKVQKEGIHIMTFHGSKGLEFDEVIIPDCNEGVIPHRKSFTEEAIEEERRLFYVAMTRAKEILHLTFVKGDSEQVHLISRFLKKIYKT